MHTPPIPGTQQGQRVRTITLQVETLDGGGLRLSTPLARGWATVARTQLELARGIEQAYREVACASYARARGRAYDLDAMTTHVPGDTLAAMPQQRVRGAGTRSHRAQRVEAWSKLEDGRWRSPSGRAYRAESMHVQNVIRKRAERGLPT